MPRRQAFTLIELLVVITIIVVLIAVLLPTLAGAKEESWRTVCRSQLRQIAIACEMYASEHAEQYPPSDPYTFQTSVMYMQVVTHDRLINSYLNWRRDAMWCPRDAETRSYGYNDLANVYSPAGWYIGYFLYYSTPSNLWGPGRRSAMQSPSATRAGSDYVWIPGYDDFAAHTPSRQFGANQLFGDSSVRWRRNEQLVYMADLKVW